MGETAAYLIRLCGPRREQMKTKCLPLGITHTPISVLFLWTCPTAVGIDTHNILEHRQKVHHVRKTRSKMFLKFCLQISLTCLIKACVSDN